MNNTEQLQNDLEEWVERYKDVSERHALAETPKETAEYLMGEFLQPYLDQQVKEAVEKGRDLEREVIATVLMYKDWFGEKMTYNEKVKCISFIRNNEYKDEIDLGNPSKEA